MQAIKTVLGADRPAGGRGKGKLGGVKAWRHGGGVALCGWAGAGKGMGWGEKGDQQGWKSKRARQLEETGQRINQGQRPGESGDKPTRKRGDYNRNRSVLSLKEIRKREN